jgi:orotate phosphoribosyltransferase
MVDKRAEIRGKALEDLQHSGVLMLNGHFDYGNGYHGRAYLNPHQLFRQPSTIWRFAQDLLDIVPSDLLQSVELVAGPATGGALLAHTLAGLLDSRRSLTHPSCLFAPFHHNAAGGFTIRDFYRSEIKGKRVLLADDVRNTGETFERCATLVKAAGGVLVATVEIYDRMEAVNDLDVPNMALAEFRAPENYKAGDCPLCTQGLPITRF